MAGLMLVNPRKRRGTRKTHRTAAQRRATKKLVAMNRRRRRTHSSTTHRRRNPIGIKRVTRRASRRRRNPIRMRGMGGLGDMLMIGLKGASGAIVVNAISHYLPAVVMQGKVQYVTRSAVAMLLGTVGSKLLGRNARVMAEGAMVVVMHDFINSMAGTMLPGSDMHGMGEFLSEDQAGMGEFLSGQNVALPHSRSGTVQSPTGTLAMAGEEQWLN